jgi:hypothetical protein
MEIDMLKYLLHPISEKKFESIVLRKITAQNKL